MVTKRRVVMGGIALVLATFLLTASAFMYFFHLVSGDVLLTVKFFRALQIVNARYIDDVPVETLMNGAIGGLVRSLDDPHSLYMGGELFKQFMAETEGQFGGIGISVAIMNNMLTVVSHIEGTPGEAAGIRKGDRIIKIDGEDTAGMPLDIAVSKIRGPKDTFVEIVLLRDDGEEKTIKIMRTNIKLKSVTAENLGNGAGYIRITTFNEHTHEEFAEEIKKLDQEEVKGIVLDLRGNPGGLLESCVKIAEYFVPKGPIVSITGRTGLNDVMYSHNKNPKYKVVVLVDEGSASASEIVAAAIQDTKAGTIVGKKTYGKGSVQSILLLDSASAVKITIAKYYTPSGRTIDGVGVMPDVEVANTQTHDWQMDKATDILHTQLNEKSE